MSTRTSACALAVAASMLVGAGQCADDVVRNADDVARAASHSGDEIASARRSLAQIAEAIAAAGRAAAERAATRISEVVERMNASSELDEALEALAWEVGCDIAGGSIPKVAEEVEGWLLDKAVSFGIEFLGDGAQVMAEGLLATLDETGEASDAAEACQRIEDAGF